MARCRGRLERGPAGLLLAALFVVAVGAAACGGDDGDGSPTPPAQSSPIPKVEKTPGADGTITVVARNVAFDTDKLFAPAGMLKVVLDNRDPGTAHDIHFFRGVDADGEESVGETPLENGPSQDMVEMELTPGAYFFHCDVHPSMKGTLTVQ
jgi:plastocyanin